jgi:hypothetical protein
MPGLMKQWFVPSNPPKPKMNVTQNYAAAPGAGGASAVAPGVGADQFRQNETARYQQMLAGLGIGQEGGALPQGIQENIDRQASLIQT